MANSSTDIPELPGKRGDTFRREFTWTQPNPAYVEPVVDPLIPERIPIDLTGCTARLQFRKGRDDPAILDFSTADSELSIDGPNGVVLLDIPAATMETLLVTTYKSDLELTYPDGTVCSTETFHVKVSEDQTV